MRFPVLYSWSLPRYDLSYNYCNPQFYSRHRVYDSRTSVRILIRQGNLMFALFRLRSWPVNHNILYYVINVNHTRTVFSARVPRANKRHTYMQNTTNQCSANIRFPWQIKMRANVRESETRRYRLYMGPRSYDPFQRNLKSASVGKHCSTVLHCTVVCAIYRQFLVYFGELSVHIFENSWFNFENSQYFREFWFIFENSEISQNLSKIFEKWHHILNREWEIFFTSQLRNENTEKWLFPGFLISQPRILILSPISMYVCVGRK